MLNHDKLKDRRAGARSGSSWKPKEGDNRLCILPTHSRFLTEMAGDIAIGFKMHFFRIEGRPTEVSLCLEELKQRCPACETWRVWRKTEDAAMKEMAKSIGPSDQYLINAVVHSELDKGIQPWPANYTCWDKILEIAANPQWGSVDDPSNCVVFNVHLTPKNKSRTGYNSYSVMPDPGRVNMMPFLEAIPDWRNVLNNLETNKTPPKTPDEIANLLREMGFQVAGVATTHAMPGMPPGTTPMMAPALPMAAPAAPQAFAPPAPQAFSAPAPQAFVPPQPAPAFAPPAVTMPPAPIASPPQFGGQTTMQFPPAGAAPTSFPPAPAPAPQEFSPPAPMAAPQAPSTMPPAAPAGYSAAPAPGVFDPGPEYQPKMPDNLRPAGVPRCFSDYNPTLRPCRSCPVIADCQMKFMGMGN